MPIVDIQRRFRELGRIRMGVLEKPQGGKPRPKKLARFRLTSKWRHLLDDAAAVYGGEVHDWEHPQDGHQYELFVEADALNVVIPPGEVLSQWLELWAGGGCKRRCDGVRQVLVDAPCACPDDLAERRARAAANPPTACKETTRLLVMLPDVSDLGVWRLESHGYYAAVELAGAAGLCELATRRGTLIPARLALEARSVKRQGEPIRRFAVPALSFRGNLGETLEALGMTQPSGIPILAGVEPRPAITAGEQVALPAAPTGFGEAAPTETAALPPAAPDLDPSSEPFAPPEREEPEPEAERAGMTWAQMAAMRANDAGIDDAARHGLYLAISSGRTSSGKELDGLERNQAMAAIVSMTRGTKALGRAEFDTPELGIVTVWALIDETLGVVAHGCADAVGVEELPPGRIDFVLVSPPKHHGKAWVINPDEPSAQRPAEATTETAAPPASEAPTLDGEPDPTVDAPAAPAAPEPSEAPETADSSAPPYPPAAPPFDVGSVDAWRAYMKARTLRVSDVIKVAIGLTTGGDPPGNLDGLTADLELAANVARVLEAEK